MIERDLRSKLVALAGGFPAVTVTGPRQSGKSTLCQMAFPDLPRVNLEKADFRDLANRDAREFLSRFPKGAILDEIQRAPELPSWLQAFIDEEGRARRWILTGSQNLIMLSAISQSLAGRTGILHLFPLTRNEVRRFEVHPRGLEEALIAGAYPAVFDVQLNPADWYEAYVGSYIERDVRTITNIGDLTTFRRFLELCAGRTAQLTNLSTLAAECGVSQPTARAWLSVLETSYIVFRLPGFFANVRKRLTRMPKLHFYDTGLVCWLLGIRSAEHLRSHPLRGAIFETWVVSEILKHRANLGEYRGLHFYRDQNAVEADLVIERGSDLTIVEAKAGRTITDDMLKPASVVSGVVGQQRATRAFLIYAGDDLQQRREVSVVGWDQLDSTDWA